MQELNQKLENSPVIFVTRDFERATGISTNTRGYYIISNFHGFDYRNVPKEDNILFIEEKELLDTRELLQHPKAIQFINKIKDPNILVFKNTKQIERTCREKSRNLLNPSAELVEKIEGKISQVEWLENLTKYLPETQIVECKDLVWKQNSFILQFNYAHTGSGTHLIESEEELKKLQQKFPDRSVRISEYIKGPTFTVNVVVAKNKILIGNPSYQITGLEPFTDKKFATIGNDWGVVSKILNEQQLDKIKTITKEVGEKMRESGWKGLFGVDVVVDEKNAEVYLIEINARQPASNSYESILQKDNLTMGQFDNGTISIFEAHLSALLELDIQDKEFIKINDGAQIIQRVTDNIPSLLEPKLKNEIDFDFITYKNTKPGSELLRIQTPYSLMEKHNKLNEKGKMMVDFIIVTKYGKTWNSDRGGIIAIQNNKILLVERHKYGRDFFCLPGGTPEGDENIEETVLREGKEETGLNFTIPDQKPIYFHVNGRDEYYFFVDNIEGEAKLSGEEAQYTTEENSYALKWIDLDKLGEIDLLPEGVSEKILNREQRTENREQISLDERSLLTAHCSLSKPALSIINDYLNLKFGNNHVRCPYFNNKRAKVRAGLRVLIGKGNIKEIREEVKIISVREKIDLRNFSKKEITKFLVDHNIGIDCSGFVYYVLDSELKAQGKGSLKKYLHFTHAKNPIRKLLVKLRPVENTNVKVLAHELNSKKVELGNIQPGDLITMIGSKEDSNPDHVLIVHEVDYENEKPVLIHYSHSFGWKSDGKYNHGVRQGRINIVDLSKGLLEQKWIENGKSGEENETSVRAKKSDVLEMGRIFPMSFRAE